jgi:hypothetical protein
MTVPEDDFSRQLARELHAEAAQFMPGDDGLDRIREQLRSRRPTQSWGGLRVAVEMYGYSARHLAAEILEWAADTVRPGGFARRWMHAAA